MIVNRCSRSVHGDSLKGHVDCGKSYLEIQDGAFVEVNPLDAKKLYDPEMFKIENLSESGIELRELTLESNDVLGAANIVNGTIDVVNYIGVSKTTKNVLSSVNDDVTDKPKIESGKTILNDENAN